MKDATTYAINTVNFKIFLLVTFPVQLHTYSDDLNKSSPLLLNCHDETQ